MTITEISARITCLPAGTRLTKVTLGTHQVPEAMVKELNPGGRPDIQGRISEPFTLPVSGVERTSLVFATEGWVGAQIIAVAKTLGTPNVCLTIFKPFDGDPRVFHGVIGKWTELRPQPEAGSRAATLRSFYSAELAALHRLVEELAADERPK